jgi:beta-fructofuranosidase
VLRLRAGDASWEVPWGGGQVRVILDAQAVEVSTRDGVLGVAVAPVGPAYCVSASAGGLIVRPLER